MEEVCVMQHGGFKALSAAHKNWLLFLLMRSPTFYYASLNSEFGVIASQHYHEYSARALQSFHKLSDSSSLVFGEVLICGIQMAHLESPGTNMMDCRSYLNSAIQLLLKHSDLPPTNEEAPRTRNYLSSAKFAANTPLPILPLTRPSPMESRALKFFSSILIWNDMLSCSTQRKSTPAPEIYQKLLKDQEFALAFREITGCEGWVIAAIMDATNLEVWMHD
ncbi:hypothetical protein EAF04_007761 [Stromatinia cepivora]|nr:hypothetical protein EAF04_007761 [Stromatinia cepivora]